MRKVVLHHRAAKYLRRMPKDRQAEMIKSLNQAAALEDTASHPKARPLTGGLAGWYRLRIGVYRAILKPQKDGDIDILFVDHIGPRGDAY